MATTNIESPTRGRRADLGFAWAFKRSFVEYVANMQDGRMSLEGDAALTSTREFYFPYLSSAGTPAGNLVVRFRGGVTFTAHHGLMSVTVRSPILRIEGDHGVLSIDTPEGDTALGKLDGVERQDDGDVVMFQCGNVTLLESGTSLFGDSYPAGESLAPVTLRIPRSARTAPEE